MYALIVPASTPFDLLATVLALSWWEDRVLPAPPAEPVARHRRPSRSPLPPRIRSPQRPLPSSQNSPVSTLR
ncbi:hypothetical protein [Streptomyces avermitilis]|uniref:hypothetical protein n=1 Tax=Streptomyces avermitilis TaxID=33903 RepID=UPI0037FA2D53